MSHRACCIILTFGTEQTLFISCNIASQYHHQEAMQFKADEGIVQLKSSQYNIWSTWRKSPRGFSTA